ncbi:hypothetical protein ACEK07_65165 [Alcanivoracaceae bacterium MT1]
MRKKENKERGEYYRFPVLFLALALLVACGGGGGGSDGSVAADSGEKGPIRIVYNANKLAEIERGTVLGEPELKYVFTASELNGYFIGMLNDYLPGGFKYNQIGWTLLLRPLLGSGIPDVVTKQPVAGVTAAGLKLQSLLENHYEAVCGVRIYQYNFRTVNSRGRGALSSAAISVPYGEDPKCFGARPVLVNNHGQLDDDQARSSHVRASAGESSIPTAINNAYANIIFPGAGYVMVSPDYIGFADPEENDAFIQKVQNGKDISDALRAGKTVLNHVRNAIPEEYRVWDSGKLFVTGFSEGGYQTTAAVRALEEAGVSIDAASPGGNPGAILWMFDMMAQNVGQPSILRFTPKQFLGWNDQKGGIYGLSLSGPKSNNPDIILSEVAAESFPDLPEGIVAFPRGVSFQNALNESDKAEIAEGPYYGPLVGSVSLLNLRAGQALIDDVNINPCPGSTYERGGAGHLPGVAYYSKIASPLSCTPDNPLRDVVKSNDLRDYVPHTRMLMCGSVKDGTVFYEMTEALAGYYLANGYPEENLDILELNTPMSEQQTPYQDIVEAYQSVQPLLAKLIPDQSLRASAEHVVAGVFCIASARSYFDGIMAGG